MSKQIASSTKDFASDTLLVMAIWSEKSNNDEGTEDNPAED